MSPFQILKANLSYKSRSNTDSLFRGKWGQQNQPNRKHGSSSKTRIMFPSNPAARGTENPSKQNLGGKFLLHNVFFMCILKLGEDFVTHVSDMQLIQPWQPGSSASTTIPFLVSGRFSATVRCEIGAACHPKNGHLNQANALDV